MDIITQKKLGPSYWAHLEAPASVVVAGIVENYQQGGEDSDKGIWFRFRGQFESKFKDDKGEDMTLRAVQAFLPDIAAYQLKAAVDSAPEGTKVNFAVELSKFKSENSPKGWEWGYKPLVEMGDNSSKSLIESIIEQATALPEAETETETEVQPVAKKKNPKATAKS